MLAGRLPLPLWKLSHFAESPTPVPRVTLADTRATPITAEAMPHAFLSLD